jgi:predicted NBD/HSP70 family sugar kinase
MRKLDGSGAGLAPRGASRALNRRIVLNLVRERQPISRVDIARQLGVARGKVTTIVAELLADGLVVEGATGPATGGRRPTYLYVRTADRLAAAVDVRASRTTVMLGDFAGRALRVETLPTPHDPGALVAAIAACVAELRAAHRADGSCEGLGVVVPGMVDPLRGRVLRAPQLGWRNVELRSALERALPLPVWVENAPVACALARLWLARPADDGAPADATPTGETSYVYVSVSDGVGTGVVIDGHLVRGATHTAGEFGHTLIDPAGPPCSCGATGCLEAFASNPATVARYHALAAAGRPRARRGAGGTAPPTIDEVIARAVGGDPAAVAALAETGRALGLGLATIVNTVNPARIYVGGEITAAWPLLDEALHLALGSRAVTAAAAATPVVPDSSPHPRLLGATALVTAQTFAPARLA